jgi:ABC-type phosphate/phosphonate transport system substrate-binding protein
VKIGMVSSLFRDVPPALVQALTPPFQSLLRDQTGMEGDILLAGDAHDVGKLLDDNQVQLGVFHGFEFAWARAKYPDLKPLVIAVNRHKSLKAHIVVRNDCGAVNLDDLKGKVISVPRRSRAHSLLFFERELAKTGCEAKGFFGDIVAHASIEDALDDVIRDKVQAVLVDGLALETYGDVKPGCHVRLKMLKDSETFPPGVVAYREGGADAATLRKFKDGMITAHETSRGKELMGLWKLTAFENVPANFSQTLDTILQAYPPPAAAANARVAVKR